MVVVLRQDVRGLANKGDVIEVADGYAQNFLIPRGLAMRAAAGTVGQAASMKRSRDVKDAQDRAGAEEVARRLVAEVISVSARAGSEGKLYGSVTMSDVADAVEAQTGLSLDRRALSTEEPIREVGSHAVSARLHDDVRFQITVEVTPA
jgi:large subunit ribosomal protein L9